MITFCTPTMPINIPNDLEGYYLLFEVKTGNNILDQDNETFYIYNNDINRLKYNIEKLLVSYVQESNTSCTIKLILMTLNENIILKNYPDAFIM